MKFLLALGTLLIAATPSLADELMYLKCMNTTKARFTEIKTNRFIKEESKEETVFFKIDLINNQFISHKDSKWDKAEIHGGILKANINKDENGLSLKGDLEIEIDPAGKLISKIDFIAWAIATEVEMNGNCNEVDKSVFEAARSQSKES